MIICELRGIVFDIKAYPIHSDVFSKLQQIKKQRSVGLVDIINDGELQFDLNKLEKEVKSPTFCVPPPIFSKIGAIGLSVPRDVKHILKDNFNNYINSKFF